MNWTTKKCWFCKENTSHYRDVCVKCGKREEVLEELKKLSSIWTDMFLRKK